MFFNHLIQSLFLFVLLAPQYWIETTQYNIFSGMILLLESEYRTWNLISNSSITNMNCHLFSPTIQFTEYQTLCLNFGCSLKFSVQFSGHDLNIRPKMSENFWNLNKNSRFLTAQQVTWLFGQFEYQTLKSLIFRQIQMLRLRYSVLRNHLLC